MLSVNILLIRTTLSGQSKIDFHDSDSSRKLVGSIGTSKYPDDYNNEDPFEMTLKSCLGDHCSNYNEKGGAAQSPRIGFLGPPSSGASLVFDIIQEVLTNSSLPKPLLKFDRFEISGSSGKSRVSSVTASSPKTRNLALWELALTTNCPPYGYGKNHGWTKIIRFYRPLVANTIEILMRGNETTKSVERNLDAIADVTFAAQVR
jgi:hypothetical protein